MPYGYIYIEMKLTLVSNSFKFTCNNIQLKRMGVFNDIDDIVESSIYLNDFDDNLFKLVYEFVSDEIFDSQKITTLDVYSLYEIYKICDYLQINDLQQIVAMSLAEHLKNMKLTELETTLKKLFV